MTYNDSMEYMGLRELVMDREAYVLGSPIGLQRAGQELATEPNNNKASGQM